MPRKTREDVAVTGGGEIGFNEAAARCRGKLPVALLPCREQTAASMRPRPDAAENPYDPH